MISQSVLFFNGLVFTGKSTGKPMGFYHHFFWGFPVPIVPSSKTHWVFHSPGSSYGNLWIHPSNFLKIHHEKPKNFTGSTGSTGSWPCVQSSPWPATRWKWPAQGLCGFFNQNTAGLLLKMWLKQCHFYHPWLGMVFIIKMDADWGMV